MMNETHSKVLRIPFNLNTLGSAENIDIRKRPRSPDSPPNLNSSHMPDIFLIFIQTCHTCPALSTFFYCN